jgi:protein-tyrosine phosphatase
VPGAPDARTNQPRVERVTRRDVPVNPWVKSVSPPSPAGPIGHSGPVQPSPPSTTVRRVVLESCQNFRDLGGYPTNDGRHVRWRRLFRSDTLHRLTQADVVVLRELGIKVVIDLRSPNEIEQTGRVSEEVGAAYHHFSMFDDVVQRTAAEMPTEPPPPGAGYVEMLRSAGDAIADATRALVDAAGQPAVIHCTAGKDRTGILAGLLLSALGIADADVAADYELTNECRVERDAYLAVHDPTYLAMLRSLPPWMRKADGEAMRTVIKDVSDRFGSARGYLASLGISAQEMATLEQALLEP